MRVMEKNVMRLVAVQHLRSAYGIKTKNWNKNKAASCKSAASNSTKVFGMSLENLPYYNMECGSVPSFLVDACMRLLAHIDTEGLFRKSGSVVRLKALRAKLDAGEECLSTALPCDVAGLVKQFFRELPEPVLPTELQEAFLKAQQLPNEEERTSATMLLSCVLPDRNLCVLRYFFDFLYNVSKRSAENKMDSSNLSVILAPNLLHSGDGTEKMNANTEKRLKLQAAVARCFIENAHSFGVLPKFLQDKVPAMMGCEAGVLSPAHDEQEEPELNSGMKRKSRRSLGDVVNGALNKIKTNRTPTNVPHTDSLVFSSATPVISTPASKRKLPLESGSSFGFSNKKRRSVIKNLGIELLPNILFNGPSTPGSACSTSGVLDSSQNVLSSAGRSRRQPTTSARKKSRRLSSRHLINRVESGKAGCFSPKISKKEAPHKSLRLRFSLGGKSSKDAASESIGLRLAKQESDTSFRFTKETEFIPSVQPGKTESKSSKFISKSEDNLLTPRCDLNAHRSLWCAETPVGAQALSGGSFTDTPMNLCLKSSYMSEPAIVVSKPPAVSSLPMKLCCASSAESLESESSIPEAQRQTGPTLLKIKKAFSESGSDLQAVIQESCKASGARISKPSNVITAPPPETSTTKSLSVPSEAPSFCMRQSLLANEQNITFGQIEIAALSPLHIDSVILEAAESYSPVIQDEKVSLCAAPAGGNNSFTVGAGEREMEMNCSKLIDALDIQSPAHFRLGVPSGRQSTPYKPGLELRNEFVTLPKTDTVVSVLHDERELSSEIGTKVQKQPTFSPHSQEAERRRVADHIQHFNKLTIYSPTGSKSNRIKSPLKFHRTPVRQTVRRINSLMGESRKPVRNAGTIANQRGQVAKAVSLESGLSPHPKRPAHHGEHEVPCSHTCPLKKPPPVPPRKSSIKSCALGDVTNKVQSKTQVDCSTNEPSGAQKPLQQLAGKDMNYYRGSPRNPLNQGRLLSATKPVDL
ncbi:rho GTPase-activating protein 11A isoform X1 [Oreochromis aureus]|uniref:Rho-GAP domain-containing protein n=1 Tax=Oreochromis aureus TaxID=47969 RepID=A0A668TPJ0_OREAU|nr:rho GTPase-activating protein 11A isoform X1 [Oreochromis aureus]